MAIGRVDVLADRRKWLRQSLVGLLMLPLSLLPFYAYLTATAEGQLLWSKASVTIERPDLAPLDIDERRWVRANAPDYSGGAAVLVYHGVGDAGDDTDEQAMSAETFGRHLAALEEAGMTPITVSQLADACADGDGSELPDDAVAVTFDDGREESMLYADPLLEEAGWVASMFVITGAADEPGVFYASWDDLRTYAESGRWDLQGHTAQLHDVVETDDPDDQYPLLVNRVDGEDLAAWEDRVEADLDEADARLSTEAGVPKPAAFAYPFGAWGGDPRTLDDRIAPALHDLLEQRYELAFVQDDQDSVPLADCSGDPLRTRRLDVGDWGPRKLIHRLRAMAERTTSSRPPLASDPHHPGVPRTR